MSPSPLQTGNPAIGTVSRKPQTTGSPTSDAVPFVRLSRENEVQGFTQAGVAFGGLITQSLKAVGGYLGAISLRVDITGSSSTTTTATGAADAPWNILQSVMLRDPLGQPIINMDGYSLYLANRYGGQLPGLLTSVDPANHPSFSAINNTGNGSFRVWLPLQLDSSAYCSLASLNASAQPTLTVQLAGQGTVYTTAPSTVGTIKVTVEQHFWAAPVSAPQMAPPDIGSSTQWSLTQASAPVPSASFARLTLPRVGTFIGTQILVLRDKNGVRVDDWPSGDFTLYVDGVPVVIRPDEEFKDLLFMKYGASPPTGVRVFTFRGAVTGTPNLADTHDLLLPTTPATLLEIAGTWASDANLPGTLQAITQELYPVSGIPYNHLAQ